MPDSNDADTSKMSTAHSDSEANPSEGKSQRPERRGPPPNPLYHPLFLPVLLVAFCMWFGWDGFLTSDPEMLEHKTFNQVMFFIVLPICLWVVPRGIKEHREDQAKAAAKGAQPAGSSD
ncbi:MAG: hypothetical protein AB8G23_16690 [Myxococcota bacterium]